MAARIAKIKQSDGKIVIQSIESEGEAVEREIIFKSAQDPHPDLIEAFRDLEEHARFLLEWSPEYAKGRVRITGASFSVSERTGVEGALLTGQVALDRTDAPFSFNTPYLPFEQHNEGGAAKLMPEEAQEALERLRAEAQAFLDGKRAQGDFFRDQARGGKLIASEQGADR